MLPNERRSDNDKVATDRIKSDESESDEFLDVSSEPQQLLLSSEQYFRSQSLEENTAGTATTIETQATAGSIEGSRSISDYAFQLHGRYNILQDLLYLSYTNDNPVLQQLKAHAKPGACNHCLAYANDLQTLYQFHGHNTPISDKKICFCGYSTEQIPLLRNHILVKHLMNVTECEFYHKTRRQGRFYSLISYYQHVHKNHGADFEEQRKNSPIVYKCRFCEREEGTSRTQLDFFIHAVDYHIRFLMELTLLRWPDNWDPEPLKTLKATEKKIIPYEHSPFPEIPQAIFNSNHERNKPNIDLTPPTSDMESDVEKLKDIPAGEQSDEVFELNGRYNILQDVIQFSQQSGITLLKKLAKSRKAACDYCLAYANDMRTLFEYHGHITPPHYKRTCYCGYQSRQLRSIRNHILMAHVMIIIYCEFDDQPQKQKKFTSYLGYCAHVRKKHRIDYDIKRSSRSTVFICPVCLPEEYETYTQVDFLTHLVTSHFRFLMEFVVARWPVNWETRPVQSLKNTQTEVNVLCAFLHEVIPNPAGVMPPPSRSIIFQEGCFDEEGNCNLMQALLYLNFRRNEKSLKGALINLTHLGYYCTYCRAYAKGENPIQALSDHMRTHRNSVPKENQKNFKCICGRDFAREESLKDHIIANHTRGFFLCEYCNSTYNRLVTYRKHVSRTHREMHRMNMKEKRPEKCWPCCICSFRGYTQLQVLSHCMAQHFRQIIEIALLFRPIDTDTEEIVMMAETLTNLAVSKLEED